MNFNKNLRDIFSGDDGLLSGKRIIGSLLILVATILTIAGLIAYFINPILSLDSMMIFISPLFVTGTAFWSITTAASYFTAKNILPENKPTE